MGRPSKFTSYNKEVVRMSKQEKGLIDTIELFNNQLLTIPRWYNHFDTVVSLPSFLLIITGITTSGHIASAKGNQYHCVQYHPEHEPYVDLELFIMFLYQKTDSNK
jgi:GMP synthase-like glutamine amidotransferase